MRFGSARVLRLANAARVPVSHLIEDVGVRGLRPPRLTQDPGMIRDLVTGHASVRVGYEQSRDEILSLGRNRTPTSFIEVVSAGFDLLKQREVVFVVEWRSS